MKLIEKQAVCLINMAVSEKFWNERKTNDVFNITNYENWR